MQYIALIHINTDTNPSSDEWNHFFRIAGKTGMFQGGSAIGARILVGHKDVVDTTEQIGGYMRFDAEEIDSLLKLLEEHPVIKHGGTIELCELPET